MSRAATIPAETDLLCERCGYVLSGLSDEGRCPECGTPIAESRPELRKPSAWDEAISGGSFVTTSLAVIFRPTRFFRRLAVRSRPDRSLSFAILHWFASSIAFASAMYLHFLYLQPFGAMPWMPLVPISFLLVLSILALFLTTTTASRLTGWEAAYRGLRLPLPVIRRVMHFHAAHYLLVSLAALGLVGGGIVLIDRQILPMTIYLYILCGYVIVAAIYLFQSYWIGMRNVMYANR